MAGRRRDGIMMWKSAWIAVLAWGVAGAAMAQDPSETAVEDVTVTASSTREAVQSFIAEVGAAPEDTNLARFHRTVCVGVVNMNPAYAQVLIERISDVAQSIGLQPGDAGCRPNILVLADSDGDALANWLVEDNALVFRPTLGGNDRGLDALDRFRTSGAAVRWWHISNFRHTPWARASHIRDSVEQQLIHAIIILDTTRLGVMEFGSLTDFLAMVSLAQIDPEADTRAYPTILNLFSADTADAASRLTDWNRDYLAGLYSARGDALDQSRQAREIARDVEMARTERQITADPPGN